jgi:hypothetical protein
LSREIICCRLRLVLFHRLFGATAIPDVQERQNTRQSLLYSDSIHDLATLYHSILLNTRRDGRGPRTPQVSEGRCRGGNSKKITAPNRRRSPAAFAILRVLILCLQIITDYEELSPFYQRSVSAPAAGAGPQQPLTPRQLERQRSDMPTHPSESSLPPPSKGAVVRTFRNSPISSELRC